MIFFDELNLLVDVLEEFYIDMFATSHGLISMVWGSDVKKRKETLQETINFLSGCIPILSFFTVDMLAFLNYREPVGVYQTVA